METNTGPDTVDEAATLLAEVYTCEARAVASEELAFARAVGAHDDARYWTKVVAMLTRDA